MQGADELASLKGLRGAKRIGDLIREYAETARLSRKLTEICTTAPLPEGLDTAVSRPNLEGYDRLSEEMGMKPWRRTMFLDYAHAVSLTSPPPFS